MNASDDFLAAYNESDWDNLTQTQKQQVLEWKDELDSFNNSNPEGCIEDWWKNQ